MRIVAVIPAYNEAKNLPELFRQIDQFAGSSSDREFIPVLVNDGSMDSTAQWLAKNRPAAQYVLLPINLGIGKAVQTGLKVARDIGADIALQLDGDGQHLASEISKIIQPIMDGKADVTVGSRYHKDGGGNVSTSLRQAGTALFSWLIFALTGKRIKDVTSGFRAFSKPAIRFLADFYPDDYPEVQSYVPLSRAGFRILEVPVQMRPRQGGKSSISPTRAAYYMVKVSLATLMDALRPAPKGYAGQTVTKDLP